MARLLLARRGERLLPVVSALLLAACYPPLHPLVLPFVGLVPIALFVDGLPPDLGGRRAAVRGGLLFGALYFGIVFYWIFVALVWFSALAILAYLASVLVLAAAAGLFAWILHRAVHEVRVPLWLALPVAWTATEWFRAHWPGPLAFPWLGLGSSLTGFPEWVGIAELVGARGVTFWLAMCNGLLATWVVRLRREAPWAPIAAVLLFAVIAPPAWGEWRARTLDLREVGRVTVVQPNIPEHVKLDPQAAQDSTLASLQDLLPRLVPGSMQLVVLPEVVLSFYPKSPGAAPWLDRIQAYSREVGAPILFGALGYEGDLDGAYAPRNSAFLMRPQGLADYEYSKRYLVPVVERAPLFPERWLGRFEHFGTFVAGQGWPVARVDEAAYAPIICYESTYPQAARRFRLEGADVLVNISNDAWYGREPWYARTTALWQHPAHLVMRAIENRMGVARAANTGISLFVDPVGRIHDATPLFRREIRTATVITTDVTTFYTRYGDLAGNGSAMLAVLLVGAAWGRRRRVLDR